MMFRSIIASVALLGILSVSGCKGVQKIEDDPRFHPEVEQALEAQIVGYNMPTGYEVDLVEQMAGSRTAYRISLESLAKYYESTGSAIKHNWARQELDSFMKGARYHYLMTGQVAGARLSASSSIPEADALFDEAIAIYKDAGGLVIITDSDKLRLALNKFNLVISQYPTSDKIDDAAYRAGRIYEHFKENEIAAVYYQRAYQWDPHTPYPARFKAGYLFDRRLRMRKEALIAYQLSIEREPQYEENVEHAKSRILQMTKIATEDEIDETENKPQPPQ